jgi:hypothetical protein
MKLSWSETILWLSILSLTVTMSAEFFSDYIGINSWTILYFGIGIAAIAIFLIILKFIKRNEKAKTITISTFLF